MRLKCSCMRGWIRGTIEVREGSDVFMGSVAL
jgi:hypothetical protein